MVVWGVGFLIFYCFIDVFRGLHLYGVHNYWIKDRQIETVKNTKRRTSRDRKTMQTEKEMPSMISFLFLPIFSNTTPSLAPLSSTETVWARARCEWWRSTSCPSWPLSSSTLIPMSPSSRLLLCKKRSALGSLPHWCVVAVGGNAIFPCDGGVSSLFHMLMLIFLLWFVILLSLLLFL